MLEYADDTKMRKLTDALMKIRDKYGMDIVRSGDVDRQEFIRA